MPAGLTWLAPVGRWLEQTVVERTFGGRERFVVIGALGGVLAVDAADKGMIGATVTQLQSTFGIGPAEVGLLVTVSGLVAVAATLPFGVLVDRVARRRSSWWEPPPSPWSASSADSPNPPATDPT